MDFWIGDWVKDMISGKTGRYEGLENGKVKLRAGDVFLWVSKPSLVLLKEEEIALEQEKMLQNIANKSKKKVKKTKSEFNSTLDLHINRLAPHLEGKQPEMILLHQITKARSFIKEAIQKHQLSIVLIHGKGTGALKMEIGHLLMEFDEVLFVRSVNNGGAIEILFRY